MSSNTIDSSVGGDEDHLNDPPYHHHNLNLVVDSQPQENNNNDVIMNNHTIPNIGRSCMNYCNNIDQENNMEKTSGISAVVVEPLLLRLQKTSQQKPMVNDNNVGNFESITRNQRQPTLSPKVVDKRQQRCYNNNLISSTIHLQGLKTLLIISILLLVVDGSWIASGEDIDPLVLDQLPVLNRKPRGIFSYPFKRNRIDSRSKPAPFFTQILARGLDRIDRLNRLVDEQSKRQKNFWNQISRNVPRNRKKSDNQLPEPDGGNQNDSEPIKRNDDQPSSPSYMSPTLNVIDDGPNTTKIAHNILIVHKNSKLNKLDPKVNMDGDSKQLYHSTTTGTTISKRPLSPVVGEMDELEFVPIKNNHRPSSMMSLAKWKQKNKITTAMYANTIIITSTTSTTTQSPKTNSIQTAFGSWNDVDDDRIDSSSSLSTNAPTRVWTTTTPTSTTKTRSQTMNTPFITTTHSPVTIKLKDQFDSELMAHQQQQQPSTIKVATTDHGSVTDWADMLTTTVATTVVAKNQTMMMETLANQKTNNTPEPAMMLMPSAIGDDDDDGGDVGGQEQNAWNEMFTSINPTIDGLTTVTENPSFWSTMVTNHYSNNNNNNNNNNNIDNNEDNSIEFLKEFNEKHTTTTTTSRNNPASYSSTQSSLIGAYAWHHQHHHHHNSQRPDDDGESIIVFKNNHIRPRPKPPSPPPPPPPAPTPLRPSTVTNAVFRPTIIQASTFASKFTAKPPYATIFKYPTTIVPQRKTSITVSNVIGHRLKQPEEIKSATLTVLDPPMVSATSNNLLPLPVNTTIVHKNLLVPMKEGRPRPTRYPPRPTTPVFPVYPVVAGVWHQSQTTQPPPWLLPMVTVTTSNPPNKLDDIMQSLDSEPISSNITFSPEEFAHLFSQTTTTTSTSTSTSTTTKRPTSTTTLPPEKIFTKKIAKYPNVNKFTYKPPERISYTHSTTPSYSYSTRRPSLFRPPSRPIFGRPYDTLPLTTLNLNDYISRWTTRLKQWWTSITPNSTNNVTLMSFVRSLVYSLMVMILPPLALMTFFTA